MKRTPLRPGTTRLERRTPLRSVGRRAKREEKALARFRTEVRERAGGMCEVRTPSCPPGPHRGAHAHHVKTRAQGGGHDPDNGLYVCPMAHIYLHANPAESYQRGWLWWSGRCA